MVGSLWATYLSRAGYEVNVFERRPDIRKADIAAGKSINLAMSHRGWSALEQVGLADEVKKIAIAMPGRIMHDLRGELTYQAYGTANQAIYSVSRGHLNALLMNSAEAEGRVKIHYNQRCVGADLENATAQFEDTQTGARTTAESDVLFATDGAFSAVRYLGFQKLDRFNYSQQFIADGYRELLLPAAPDGSYLLEKNALHIWPRGRFMLIALPNEDGSFTCTLFMPFEGENSFSRLTSTAAINAFFQSTFPDFFKLMPDVADSWDKHPLSSLPIVRCFPWVSGRTALMGDAAHATVPFYGQGMNAGFEDCAVMWQLMQQHDQSWPEVFQAYQHLRKPDGDGVQDLSMHNYLVMRDRVADPQFLLQKRIEAHFSAKHPNKWLPLYTMVSFTNIRYSEAWSEGQRQQRIMDEVMATPGIEQVWNSPQVEEKMLRLLGD